MELLEIGDEDHLKTFPTLMGSPAFTLYKSIVIQAKLPQKTSQYDYVKPQFMEAFPSKALIDTFHAQVAKRKLRDGNFGSLRRGAEEVGGEGLPQIQC